MLTLNCPLTDATRHLIDEAAIETMKPGVMLVNTGRGALVDTVAVIEGLKSGRIGSLAVDVYEEEGPLFFEDRSDEIIHDDVFARLLIFPNVLDHRPPGVPHRRGAGSDRGDDARERRRPRLPDARLRTRCAERRRVIPSRT